MSLSFFTGKKTYVAAVVVAVITGLRVADVITQEQADTAYGLAAAFGLIAVRAAISKI